MKKILFILFMLPSLTQGQTMKIKFKQILGLKDTFDRKQYTLSGNGILSFSGTNASYNSGMANQLLRRNAANTAYEFFTPNYLTSEADPIFQAKGFYREPVNGTIGFGYAQNLNDATGGYTSLITGSGAGNFLPLNTPAVLYNSVNTTIDNGYGSQMMFEALTGGGTSEGFYWRIKRNGSWMPWLTAASREWTTSQKYMRATLTGTPIGTPISDLTNYADYASIIYSNNGGNSKGFLSFRDEAANIGAGIESGREGGNAWNTYLSFYTNNQTGGSTSAIQERMRLGSSGALTLSGYAGTAGRILTFDGNGTIGSITPDGFIQNQYSAAQSGNAWINGNLRTGNLVFDAFGNQIRSYVGYLGILDSAASAAVGLKSGSLVVSNTFADVAPTAGIYVKGNSNLIGNVGIGNNSPAQALDVTGTIRQSAVASKMVKTNASGDLVAAVDGVDYLGSANFASGGYTPSVSGIGGFTVKGFTYLKIGDVVHVAGTIQNTGLTVSTNYTILIDLPVASTISNTYDIVGHITGVASSFGNTISGYTGGNKASALFRATATAELLYISFQYRIQ